MEDSIEHEDISLEPKPHSASRDSAAFESADEAHEEESLLNEPPERKPDLYLAVEPPGSISAPSQQLLSESARRRFLELIYWQEPKLVGFLFGFFNLLFLLVCVARLTLLSLLANSTMLAILLSAGYRAASWIYEAAMQKPLHERVRREMRERAGLDFSEHLLPLREPPVLALRGHLSRLAGALEGGANVLLQTTWQAVLLDSPWLTVRVFCVAYALSKLGARLDALQLAWLTLVLVFTLPKLWSLRPPVIDERMALASVQARRAWAKAKEGALSQLPPSVLAKAL